MQDTGCEDNGSYALFIYITACYRYKIKTLCINAENVVGKSAAGC